MKGLSMMKLPIQWWNTRIEDGETDHFSNGWPFNETAISPEISPLGRNIHMVATSNKVTTWNDHIDSANISW